MSTILVLYDERLPFDGVRPSTAELKKLKAFAEVLDCERLQTADWQSCEALISLHGRYVPVELWEALTAHLRQGMGLVTLGGGTPFSVPVSVSGGQIRVQKPQSAYHEQLGICHGLEVKADRYNRLAVNPDIPVLQGYEDCFSVSDTVSLIVKFTQVTDSPHELGGSGPMDARIRPLLTGYGEKNRPMAAPVVLIENLLGDYAGGRWIFANQPLTGQFWEQGGAALLERLAGFAAGGVKLVELRSNYASYFPGERPSLRLRTENLSGGDLPAGRVPARITARVLREGTVLAQRVWETEIGPESGEQTCSLPLEVEPGFYELECRLEIQGEPARTTHSGFWGFDRELLESGEPVRCGRDYFYRDGKPMPVVGMTYMQSDNSRKFLFQPNPYLWDRDMAELKRAGVNMIRTGIWTGLRHFSLVDGEIAEDFLRALDAMFLTAKKHGLPIVFNLFAFVPEAWEGLNGYLDPRSIKAQKRFVSALACRHANSTNVMWDLINEPSLCTLQTNWGPKPNRDPYELAAWREWLRQRHGTVEALRERWNCTPLELPSFETATLPADADMVELLSFYELSRKPLKSVDYVLFTQDVMNGWAREMVRTIRAAGSEQLITVGQDEALGGKRPSPFFYEQEVDYTTNHSWWQNDHLYWDGIFAKTPGKPCLIQETGIMYEENQDGTPRWDEARLRDVLERKYALAFAADNAGAVHWVWNINHYMVSLNEVNIGAVCPDGSQKLEADVSYDYGEFIGAVSHLFEGRKPAETAVVFPYSNSFSIRDYATGAAQSAARVLGYSMQLPFHCYGEYQLEALGKEKLVILPSAVSLSQKAWDTLLRYVRGGGTLLLSGIYSQDEYCTVLPSRREELGLQSEIRPISREETLAIGEREFPVSFHGVKYDWVNQECASETGVEALHRIPLGKGTVLWCPVPVENSDSPEVVEAVYQEAVSTAGVTVPFAWETAKKRGILLKKLGFEKGAVYVAVSERSSEEELAFRDTETGVGYRFRLPAGRAFLFAADEAGRVLKSYRNLPVQSLDNR